MSGSPLGRELAEILSTGARVLIPRAAIGNRELVEELNRVEGVEIDFLVFTSASTVRSFAAGLELMDFSKINAVCIGRQTRAAAEAFGMRTWTARQAAIAALTDCVEQAATQRKEEQP